MFGSHRPLCAPVCVAAPGKRVLLLLLVATDAATADVALRLALLLRVHLLNAVCKKRVLCWWNGGAVRVGERKKQKRGLAEESDR